MKTSAGHLLKCVGCLVLASLSAAVGAAQAQEDESPVIRSTTRLVQLNVTVLDKQHHPVSGLSQGDFHVFDNGKEQTIVDFVASPGAVSPPKPSSLTISNRPGTDGGPPGVTAILIDETLLDGPAGTPLELIAAIRSARLAILSFLAGLQPGEEVGIYSLRLRGVVVIHDFTQDPTALVAAAKSLGEGGMGRAAGPADRRRLSGALRDWSRGHIGNKAPGGDWGNLEQRGALLRSGFRGIIEHLREVPGRKNLVWISSTLPAASSDLNLALMADARDANITPMPTADNPAPSPQHPETEGYYDQLRNFARSLSNADISVYPIDAMGLTVKGSANEEWSGADMIATETGGQAVFDSNALDQHLREIVAQGSGSYQIGYYPGDAAWDGKYHHLQVKVASAPQRMTVLCRKGYYAVDQSATTDTDMPILEAARSVVEAPGVGIAPFRLFSPRMRCARPCDPRAHPTAPHESCMNFGR